MNVHKCQTHNGLTGWGTGMAVGTENCILIRTRGTPTLTHGLH